MKRCNYDVEGQLYIIMEFDGNCVFFISYQEEELKTEEEETEKMLEEGDVFMKENLKFMDNEHKDAFVEMCNQMYYLDCYHLSFAYLVSLDSVVRNHIQDVFNFEDDCIKRDGLQKDWQTSTSHRTTRLAFNLWNGCYFDDSAEDGSCGFYSVNEIFCNQEYFEYYCIAINLRFNY